MVAHLNIYYLPCDVGRYIIGYRYALEWGTITLGRGTDAGRHNRVRGLNVGSWTWWWCDCRGGGAGINSLLCGVHGDIALIFAIFACKHGRLHAWQTVGPPILH